MRRTKIDMRNRMRFKLTDSDRWKEFSRNSSRNELQDRSTGYEITTQYSPEFEKNSKRLNSTLRDKPWLVLLNFLLGVQKMTSFLAKNTLSYIHDDPATESAVRFVTTHERVNRNITVVKKSLRSSKDNLSFHIRIYLEYNRKFAEMKRKDRLAL